MQNVTRNNDFRNHLIAVHVLVGKDGAGQPYSYTVPETLRRRIYIGAFVIVPFGSRYLLGVVIGQCTPEEHFKPLYNTVDNLPGLAAQYLTFLRWVADYYLCSPGNVLAGAVPLFGKRALNSAYRIREDHPSLYDIEPTDIKRLRAFCETATSKDRLPSEFGIFQKIGLVIRVPLFEKEVIDSAADSKPKTAGQTGGKADAVRLTADQSDAVSKIQTAMLAEQYAGFLLFGVTGSGKTEVYLRAAEMCLEQGRDVLVLVPEIGLTPQNVAIFTARLNRAVTVKHSKKSRSLALTDWLNIRTGKVKVVIGTRSALFAPLSNIGLIIVDEEHDASFKQQEPEPYYHARDCAVNLARLHNAVFVAGSATPSIESYHNSRTGKYTLLNLPERVFQQPPADVHIINPRVQPARPDMYYLTHELEDALHETYAAKKQSLLFINRRGYARMIGCQSCKNPVFCPNCSIPLHYSEKKKLLECHHCMQTRQRPANCPTCASTDMKLIGLGTERIEGDLRRLFPKSRILVFDAENITGEKAWKTALSDIAAHKVDFIVGTQMVVKGHDFSGIGLVAVMFPDFGLNYPDYRASERVFQQLVQAAGRTGRTVDGGGRVIVQTYHPDHPVIRFALNADYAGFQDYTLAIRQAMGLPPFSRQALLQYSDSDEQRTYRGVNRLHQAFVKKTTVGHDLMGPVESPLYKLRNRFYWQWTVQKSGVKTLHSVCVEIRAAAAALKLPGKFQIVIDPVKN